jgi:AraC family transcriptional regulator of adaptative response / DNA-3-methyladenine glycosylase II
VSERHLHRTLVSELGVGPLGLARTRRAQTARLLLEQTDLAVTDVAFAAGFASIRQFNDVVREEFAATPSQLRARGPVADRPAEGGPLLLRLPTRPPWDPAATMAFLAVRSIPGLECSGDDGGYARVLSTRAGPALVTAWAEGGRLVVRLQLPELELLPTVVASVRRLFDLDADAAAVDEVLGRDAAMAQLVAARPGVRVPGAVDGFELAVRAVVGQQVSVAGARTMLGRVVARLGRPLAAPAPAGADGGAAGDLASVLEGDGLAYEFPTPASLADGDLGGIGLTGLRVATLRSLAQAVVAGELELRPGAELAAQRRALRSLPGIGPWTTEYVAMRALGDTDAFPADDLVLRREVERVGADPQRWRPWRAYAAMQLWRASGEQPLSKHLAAHGTASSGVATRMLTNESNSKES